MIPLDNQLRLFEMRKWGVLDKLRERLDNEVGFEVKVLRLAKQRLRDGFVTYGDTMYRWDEKKRERNMLEELADYVVYGTSGEHHG
jgi:hypothetical protein